MKIERTAIDDVLILEPKRFVDERGFFSETWSARAFAEAGLPERFVQDNHSAVAACGHAAAACTSSRRPSRRRSSCG